MWQTKICIGFACALGAETNRDKVTKYDDQPHVLSSVSFEDVKIWNPVRLQLIWS